MIDRELSEPRLRQREKKVQRKAGSVTNIISFSKPDKDVISEKVQKDLKDKTEIVVDRKTVIFVNRSLLETKSKEDIIKDYTSRVVDFRRRLIAYKE